MYLSTLLVNVGDNPDRPRPGRLWLRNRYRVHQRLCMAFPSESRKSDDAEFLKPFKPEDFAKQVHVPRRRNAGFLFRIDTQLGGRAAILVQSALEPDWEYAFLNAEYLLAAPPEVKSFNPSFLQGQQLRFLLAANPTRKIDTKTGPDGLRRNGKRVPVPTADLKTWLERRAEPGCSSPKNSESKQSPPGFRIAEVTQIQAGYVHLNKTMERGGGRRLRSARYEGILGVTDADNFRSTLIRGIGPAKAFGFGLLSIAPAYGALQADAP